MYAQTFLRYNHSNREPYFVITLYIYHYSNTAFNRGLLVVHVYQYPGTIVDPRALTGNYSMFTLTPTKEGCRHRMDEGACTSVDHCDWWCGKECVYKMELERLGKDCFWKEEKGRLRV
jgi:hypothetical protein